MAFCGHGNMLVSGQHLFLSPSVSPTPPLTFVPGSQQVYYPPPAVSPVLDEASVTTFLNSTTESIPRTQTPTLLLPPVSGPPLPLTPQRPSGPGGDYAMRSPQSHTPLYPPSPHMAQSPLHHHASSSPIHMSVPGTPVSPGLSLSCPSGGHPSPSSLSVESRSPFISPHQGHGVHVWGESPIFLTSPFSQAPPTLYTMNYAFHPSQPPHYSLTPATQNNPKQLWMEQNNNQAGEWTSQTQNSKGTGNWTTGWSRTQTVAAPPQGEQGWVTAFSNGLAYNPQQSHGKSSWEGLQSGGKKQTGNNGPPGRGRERVSERGEKRPLLAKVGREWQDANIQLSHLSHMEIKELIMDIGGSKYVQREIEQGGVAECVMEVIMENGVELSKNTYATYVVQKLGLKGSEDQKTRLTALVMRDFQELASDRHACRVIQALITGGTPFIQSEILRGIEGWGDIVGSIRDQSRNHVLQVAIRDTVHKEKIQFILQAVAKDPSTVMELAKDAVGCRVIQQIVERCLPWQRKPVMDVLIGKVGLLAVDQYGNYVIQRILEHGTEEEKGGVCGGMREAVLRFSQHKHASPVLEKCLTLGSPRDRDAIIHAILLTPSKVEGERRVDVLEEMMKDQYGNYVVQRMLEVAPPPSKIHILKRIKPALAHLQKFSYGRHVTAKLQKYFESKLQEESLGVGN